MNLKDDEHSSFEVEYILHNMHAKITLHCL